MLLPNNKWLLSVILYAQLLQVVVGAVVDVEIDVAFDAGKLACIGVLPEFPRALILHLGYIVVGYPIGIVVEAGVGKVFLLKFIIGI